MNKMMEYGFVCSDKDEKALLKALCDYLAPLNRTFSKNKNKEMLSARLPYVYSYYYWNLNKEKQTFIEVYPNKDLKGKVKFSDHPEAGWVLFANLKDESPPYHVSLKDQEEYLNQLMASSGFEFIKLYEYSEGEERI